MAYVKDVVNTIYTNCGLHREGPEPGHTLRIELPTYPNQATMLQVPT